MEKPDSSPLIEKRKYVRVPHEMEVNCHPIGSEEVDLECRSLDISGGGIRLIVPGELAKGQKLQLAFGSGAFDFHLGLVGVVVWSEPLPASNQHEVGIQFQDLTPELQNDVLAFIGSIGAYHGHERRRFVRLGEDVLVVLRKTQGIFRRKASGHVVDISLKGMAVMANRAFRPHTTCVAEIRLLDPVTVTARVVAVAARREEKGWLMRLRFDDLEDDARERIGRFLSNQIEQSVQARTDDP